MNINKNIRSRFCRKIDYLQPVIEELDAEKSMILDELLTWIKQNAPNCITHLNNGATLDDIIEVEKEVEIPIPNDYKEFLLMHDGEEGVNFLAIFGDGNQLLPCSEIISQYKLDQEIGKEIYDPKFDNPKVWKNNIKEEIIFVNGPVKPLHFHPKWLPMTCCNGNVFRYFDYDPAPGGLIGQIIEIDPECCRYEVIADNFTDLVGRYLIDLEKGFYEIGKDHYIERIKENDTKPTLPEWLKSV